MVVSTNRPAGPSSERTPARIRIVLDNSKQTIYVCLWEKIRDYPDRDGLLKFFEDIASEAIARAYGEIINTPALGNESSWLDLAQTHAEQVLEEYQCNLSSQVTNLNPWERAQRSQKRFSLLRELLRMLTLWLFLQCLLFSRPAYPAIPSKFSVVRPHASSLTAVTFLQPKRFRV